MRPSLLALCLLLSSIKAHATVFDVDAFVNAPSDTLTGTITIDPNLGVVTALDLVASTELEPLHFTLAGGRPDLPYTDQYGNYYGPQIYSIFFYDPAVPYSSGVLNLPIGNTGSLVGYAGGPICPGGESCLLAYYGEDSGISSFGVGGTGYDDTFEGNLVPEAPITSAPEPSSWALLVTGLLGVLGLGRQRLAV